MFKAVAAFSGFSVNDQAAALAFYKDKLGLKIEDNGMGLSITLPDGGSVFIYPKEDHQPATFTVLNLVVGDIDAAVDDLKSAGITFDGNEWTDDKDIARGIAAGKGPDVAWFKDPAGNILSVLKN